MAASFTVFEKIGDATLLMTDEELALFNNAVMLYGMHGREIDLPHPVDVYFALVREDIDNSKEAREQGKRGAAARTAAAKAAAQARWAKRDEESASDAQEPDACSNAYADACSNAYADACSNAYADASDGAYAPEHADASSQTKPDQTKPIQTKKSSKARAGAHADRPSPEEAQAYAEEHEASRGRASPPPDFGERFCDFYASKGWRVGREPMRDWRAAARNWLREDQARREARKGGGVPSAGDEYSAL